MKLLRLDLRCGWLILGMCLAGNLFWGPVRPALAAQQPEPPPESRIYIVQPGDTLYRIAQQANVTVELLAAANNIDNPTYITVGQRLIIPLPAAPQEKSLEHIVQPGETLKAIGLRYELSPWDLASANYLLRADQLAIGEKLTVQGRTEEPPPLYGRSHTVRPGETLVGLAVQYGAAPWTLATANNLPSPFFVQPHIHLWAPDPAEKEEFLDWPAPFAGFKIAPTPAVQGQTFSIHISLTHPISLTGSLMGRSLTFHPNIALVGVNAQAPVGLYTLVVTATQDPFTRYAQQIPVIAGDYGSESITVSDEVAAAMTEEVMQSETELLTELFATQTPTALWDGYFNLPTSGDVTSVFGTRRSYNLPTPGAYHTGTDFGTVVGTPVFAPAGGVVVFAQALTVRGNVIIINHGWGVMSGYWHLAASYTNPGETVTRGQHIGDTGNTGLSTGPHLHWEFRVCNIPVNGLQWVQEQFP